MLTRLKCPECQTPKSFSEEVGTVTSNSFSCTVCGFDLHVTAGLAGLVDWIVELLVLPAVLICYFLFDLHAATVLIVFALSFIWWYGAVRLRIAAGLLACRSARR